MPNYRLAMEVSKSGGLWVPEHTTRQHFFVSQNRLQLGLSQPSLIVESEASGGSMKYVDFCLQAKHKLLAYYFFP
ncbi:DNA-processing protein DprA [Microbulbifer sp. JTAC008]|uniref:DNA-processing protein DprA n=1 Tax=unclassified Microbulbifer TaxID=2619833 RepID=UPI004039E75F